MLKIKSMETKDFNRNAFSYSIFGKVICCIEWIVYITLIALLISVLFSNFVPFVKENPHSSFKDIYYAFFLGGIIGLGIGSFGHSLLGWRLFPPNENTIKKYISCCVAQRAKEVEEKKALIEEIQKGIEYLKTTKL